jgi:large conductance mechanosensitive channel
MGEFKKFIMRGNVLDLAVGVIIGAAFGKIVTSLVEDVFSPVIGLITGGLGNFNDHFISLSGKTASTLADAKTLKIPVLAYGSFITNVINFLIIAFCVFLIVKAANKIKGPEPVAAATTKDCPECAMSIPIAARKCGHCTTMLA